MPRRPAPELLTPAELDLMQLLWTQPTPASVRQLMDALPEERSIAYTTVASFLKILVEKGFASQQRSGRTLLFEPAISRSGYQARRLRHLLGSLFEGDPVALVRQLVSTQPLDEDERARLRALVEALPEDPPGEKLAAPTPDDDEVL